MARTQRVARFEKRLSASAAGFGGVAYQDKQRQQTAEPRTARKQVQAFRIEQQARAMLHGEGVAMPGLKGKGEPRQPHGRKAPALRRCRQEQERGNTASAWAMRSWPKLVRSNTSGIAARTSVAFAASDMSDVSKREPAEQRECREQANPREQKQRPSIASASGPPSVSAPAGQRVGQTTTHRTPKTGRRRTPPAATAAADPQ